MPTSLWQNGSEGHGSFGEDPYQLLGKGLEADHDQLFVVVAVTGAVICPDMHDDVLCVCPRRLVQLERAAWTVPELSVEKKRL